MEGKHMDQKDKCKGKLAKSKSGNKKDIWKRWIKCITKGINKVVGWLNNVYWTLIKIALGLTVLLEIIFLYILPNDVRKWLIVFYIFGLGFMMALMLVEEYRKDEKFSVKFIEASWLSYFAFVIAWVPVVCMLLYVSIVKVQELCFGLKVCFSAEYLLQLVYWVIAIANIVWIWYHIDVKNTDQANLNLMLKLMVVIISGAGLIMDFIGEIDFTKQFLVIAWTVLYMSYISDKRQNNATKDKN